MSTVNIGGRSSKNIYAAAQSISSAGATITLTMKYRKYLQLFTIPLLIGAAKAWAVSQVATTMGFFKVRFSITAGFAQTFPPDWKLSDANFVAATNIWTPLDDGEYEMEGTFNGTDWCIKIHGPITT
jgi:hypothetical protein